MQGPEQEPRTEGSGEGGSGTLGNQEAQEGVTGGPATGQDNDYGLVGVGLLGLSDD